MQVARSSVSRLWTKRLAHRYRWPIFFSIPSPFALRWSKYASRFPSSSWWFYAGLLFTSSLPISFSTPTPTSLCSSLPWRSSTCPHVPSTDSSSLSARSMVGGVGRRRVYSTWVAWASSIRSPCRLFIAFVASSILCKPVCIRSDCMQACRAAYGCWFSSSCCQVCSSVMWNTSVKTIIASLRQAISAPRRLLFPSAFSFRSASPSAATRGRCFERASERPPWPALISEQASAEIYWFWRGWSSCWPESPWSPCLTPPFHWYTSSLASCLRGVSH